MVNKKHRRDGICKWPTSDTDVAGSAADGMLDVTMDNIIARVTIDLAKSPNLVVTLWAVEIPDQYIRTS